MLWPYLAETVLDLKPYFKRAYKKNMTVTVFDDARKKIKKPKPKAEAAAPAKDEKLAAEWEFEKKAEIKVDQPAATGTKGEAKGEAKAEAKGEAKAEAKGEAKVEAKGEAKAEAKGEAKVEAQGVTQDKVNEVAAPKMLDAEDKMFGSPETKGVAPVKDVVSPMHSASAASAPVVLGSNSAAPTAPAPTPKKERSGGWCAKAPPDSDDEEAPLLDAKAKEKADDDKEATQMISTIKVVCL